MKTTILIDDEKDARDLLKFYINQSNQLEIIGEASNGFQAVEMVNRLKPDAIFLDIQMPGLNGFEVLTRLQEIPEVIFSTAYDQYALKAFEVHALNYLLKPYGRKRFDTALQRILTNQEKVIPLAESLLQDTSTYPSKVILHKGNRKPMINVDDIFHAEAFGDYTKVHTKRDVFLSTKGISELLTFFNPKSFWRIHRSHFVNIEKVAELRKIGRYYFVILENGIQLKVSHTFIDKIKDLLL